MTFHKVEPKPMTWRDLMDVSRTSATNRARPRRMLTMATAVVAVVVLAAGCIINGAWTPAPAPVTPVQALPTALTDVSCVSEDWCLALGSMELLPLAEVWDGSSWSVMTAPSMGGQDNTRPDSVACGTPTSCVARVSRLLPSPDVIDYVVAWDGEQWHELAGSEGPYVDLFPHSCTSDGTCVIVDNRNSETLIWDGDSVTRIPFSTTSPGWDVTAIDCLAGDRCVAATSYTTAVWDGATWSELAGSDYSDIFFDGGHSIACFTEDRCLAVGPNAAESSVTSATWDGSAWTEVALPAGVTSIGVLECVGNECLVGASGPGTGGMLAWNGGGWYQAPPAPSGTRGFSCLPGWCLGVGSGGSPITPTAVTYEWSST